jgi:hypothetical protein
MALNKLDRQIMIFLFKKLYCKARYVCVIFQVLKLGISMLELWLFVSDQQLFTLSISFKCILSAQ